MFIKLLACFKTFKLKYQAKKKPDLIKYILKGLEHNQEYKEHFWQRINEVEGPVVLNPVTYQAKLKETLTAVGYGYDLKIIAGDVISTLVITKDEEFEKTVVFYNNNQNLIIERLNGFIGYDTRLAVALVQLGLKNLKPISFK